MKEKKAPDIAQLRRQAEEQIALRPFEAELNLSVMDILKLSHELSVHQIELEMQNDELMLQNDEIEHKAVELVKVNKKLSDQNKELNERTLELLKKSKKLAEFKSYYIGMESQLTELKKEVNQLLLKSGEEIKYKMNTDY